MDENSKDLRDVVSKMAHDLRTPLAVVQTTTNMLLNPKYKFSDEQVREQHQRIQPNLEVMNQLVGQLSELAKPEHEESPGGGIAAMPDGG
jgi:K+-sensing histidine kinase KdpD